MTESAHNIRQITALICGRWLSLFATFFVPIVLVRVLSRENYGLYCQFNTVSLFLVSIFSFAIGNNIYYFIPRATKNDYSKVLINSLVALLLTGMICCLFLQIPLIKKNLLSEQLQYYSVLISINILMQIPTTMVESTFIALEHKRISIWYPGSVQFSRCLILVLFALFSAELKGVLWGLTIAHMFICLFSFSYIMRCIYQSSGFCKIDFVLAKKQIRYSIPIGLSNIVNTSFRYFDKLLCIHYISSSEYALYAVAFMGIPGVIQVIQSFSDVYLLNITKTLAEGKKDFAVMLLKEVEMKTFSFSFPIVLTVVLWAEEILTLLFSSKYAGAVPYFQVYVFTLSFYALAAGYIASGAGKSHFHFYSNLSVACFMLPSIFWLVKNYGPWGGIIGVVVTQFSQRLILATMEMFYLHEKISNFFPWKQCLLIFVLSIVFLLPWYVIRHFFHPGWICGGICSILYLLTVSMAEIYCNIFVLDKTIALNALKKIEKRFICQH